MHIFISFLCNSFNFQYFILGWPTLVLGPSILYANIKLLVYANIKLLTSIGAISSCLSSLDAGLESNRDTGLESSLDAGLEALDSGLEGMEVSGRCLVAWRSKTCLSRSFRAERLRLLESFLSGSPLDVHLLWAERLG